MGRSASSAMLCGTPVPQVEQKQPAKRFASGKSKRHSASRSALGYRS